MIYLVRSQHRCFFFLNTTKDIATRKYAKQHAKLAASTIQTNMTRPNKGAMIEVIPSNESATTGVLYLG